jgi:hypothetical protein
LATPERENKFARYVVALAAVGALARFPMMVVLRRAAVFVYSDLSYLQTAQAILRLDFHALGYRVPVYPLLVALCGLNPHALWFAQSILGIGSSLMIFAMAFRRTHQCLYAFLIGLLCSLTPEVLAFESSLMTEALTNFLLVSSLWLITRYEGSDHPQSRYPLALGSVLALLSLTRPLMICLLRVYWGFLVPLRQAAKTLQREALKRTGLFALPVMVMVLGWCGFNYLNNGYFSPTTGAGGNLMDQVDPYVELAPERFALPRDTWLQTRRAIGSSVNRSATLLFGAAVQAMERRTGKTDVQISREYQSLALYLQIHHPLLCLRRAQQSWMQFWAEPTLDELEWPERSKVTLGELVMTLVNFSVREVEAAFLVLALLSIPCALLYRKAFTKMEYLIFAVVLRVSIFAAFTEYGENRRFCVPFYMLIVYTPMTRGWVWITATSSVSALNAARG